MGDLLSPPQVIRNKNSTETTHARCKLFRQSFIRTHNSWLLRSLPRQLSFLVCRPTLDKDQLSNYRPISNLSLISKIIERVVKSRLTDHLVSNGLHNPHQSAYCKHHSTETALLYIHIHDHLINAIGSQKLSCLCLFDLSAAFDTIDHKILITRLSSWFGIRGSVLNWFKSYLTSRSFRVKCDKDFSTEHISSCGVPQGSVLGPLLFVMYTTPLSTLISSLSLNHHLYAVCR